LTARALERTVSSMDTYESHALWQPLADALEEADLPRGLRDRIDNPVGEIVRAERADVLSNLVIGIDNDGLVGLESFVRRPLN
jgi:hypothetical protein